jgi:O-antigen/teichoic acid export membrane protein
VTDTSSPSARRLTADTADLVGVARQFSATLVGSIVSVAFGFVLVLIVARGIGAEGAGVFFVTLGLFAVLLGVLKLGADLGAMRMIARYLAFDEPDAVRVIIRAGVLPVALLSAVVAVAVFAVAPELGPSLARNAPRTEVTSLLRAVIVFLPIATVSAVVVAATRGFGTMRPYIITEQIGTPLLATLGVGVVVTIAPTANWLLGIAWAVPAVLGLLYASFALRKLVARLPRLSHSSPRVIWLDFWRFSFVRALASVAQILVRWLDVLLVGALVSARDAGIYAAVSRFVLVGTLTQRAIIPVLGPRFSGLLAVDDHRGAQTLYQTSTAWLVSLSFPFYLLVSAFASVVVLMFGREFEPGATSLAILSLAMLVNIATGPATTILLMAGKASWNLANSYGSLALNAGLNIMLIPAFGITGAAVAWSVSILFQNLLPTWQIFRAFRLHPLGAGVRAAGAAGVLVYGLGVGGVKAIADPSLGSAALVVAALTTVYAGVLWHFRDVLAVDSLRQSFRRRPRDSVAVENP